MVLRHDKEDPQDSSHAHAEAGDDHGPEGIARAAHGAGDDLHADIGKIERGQRMNDLHAALDHTLVGGEDPENQRPEHQHHGADQRGRSERHQAAHAHTAPDPVVFLRAEILPGEGRGRRAERAHDHPEDTVDLAVCRPGGNHVGAEAVDRGLHNDIGDIINHALQARRQANAHNVAQDRQRKADIPQAHAVHVIRAHESEHHQHGAHRLAENRRDRRAVHAEVQRHNEQQIQQHIQERAENQEIQRTLGVAHSAQDARAHVIDEVEHHSQEINADVGKRMVEDIRGCAHDGERQRRHDQSHDHEHQTARNAERRRGVHRKACLRRAVRPVILRNDDRRARGQADEKADQQVDQRSRGAAHGRQSLLAHILSHDNGVHGIVQLLKKRPQHDGEEKDQKLLPDHALCDAVYPASLRCHGSMPLPFLAKNQAGTSPLSHSIAPFHAFVQMGERVCAGFLFPSVDNVENPAYNKSVETRTVATAYIKLTESVKLSLHTIHEPFCCSRRLTSFCYGTCPMPEEKSSQSRQSKKLPEALCISPLLRKISREGSIHAFLSAPAGWSGNRLFNRTPSTKWLKLNCGRWVSTDTIISNEFLLSI